MVGPVCVARWPLLREDGPVGHWRIVRMPVADGWVRSIGRSRCQGAAKTPGSYLSRSMKSDPRDEQHRRTNLCFEKEDAAADEGCLRLEPAIHRICGPLLLFARGLWEGG